MTIRCNRLRGRVALTLCSTALALPGVAAAAQSPGWSHALHVRSVALNRAYNLGAAAPVTVAASTTPGWLTALEVRGRALNERYRLGEFSVPAPAESFRWGDAAIGAGVTAAVLLLAAATALALVRRGTGLTRSA
ncbi:MAG TPA: hypothetical protein VFK17_03045 [Gaiellaceae bacterium]|nr:hypothetical protein [Gaiellaceae bacterium]